MNIVSRSVTLQIRDVEGFGDVIIVAIMLVAACCRYGRSISKSI